MSTMEPLLHIPTLFAMMMPVMRAPAVQTRVVEDLDLAHCAMYARILENYENDVYAVERRAAEELVKLYRERLASHRMAHHKVTVWCTKGACGLAINGQPLYLMQSNSHWFRRHEPIVDLLRQIENTLELRFAKYVDKAVLTT